ncbi:MAG: hypothetical protein AcusKO_22480 [Acuticoccus sp.]
MLALPAMAALAMSALAGGAAAEDAAPKSPVGLANPASEYCVSLGGRIEIRMATDGEVGYCHLPDGRVVEEWALFHARDDGEG